MYRHTALAVDIFSHTADLGNEALTGANRRLKRGLFRSLLRIGILVARTLNTLVKPDFVKRAPSPRMLLDRQ